MRTAWARSGAEPHATGPTPGSADASSTTAPAPSAVSTHVERSAMSVNAVSFSAPMTSARVGGAAADRHVGQGEGVHEAGAGHVDVDDRRARPCRSPWTRGRPRSASGARRSSLATTTRSMRGGVEAAARQARARRPAAPCRAPSRRVAGATAGDDPGPRADPLVAGVDDRRPARRWRRPAPAGSGRRRSSATRPAPP